MIRPSSWRETYVLIEPGERGRQKLHFLHFCESNTCPHLNRQPNAAITECPMPCTIWTFNCKKLSPCCPLYLLQSKKTITCYTMKEPIKLDLTRTHCSSPMKALNISSGNRNMAVIPPFAMSSSYRATHLSLHEDLTQGQLSKSERHKEVTLSMSTLFTSRQKHNQSPVHSSTGWEERT